MNQKQEFLDALARNPFDVDTLLVFADWLQEHGEDDTPYRRRAVEPAECVYCEQPITVPEQIPGPDEDEAWEEMAHEHLTFCPWVRSRANQLSEYAR